MNEPEIIVEDITTLAVDAIVNAANGGLSPGGGVCGAIHRAAGPGLAGACRSVAPCPTGDARITPAFALPARWVIHAVGPVYGSGDAGEARQLESCYRRSLQLAAVKQLDSVAFPCISTGVFGYPRAEAARVALTTIESWLSTGRTPQRVICCCFDEADADLYRSTWEALSADPGPGGGAPDPS